MSKSMQIPVIFSSNPLYKVLEPAAISLRGTRQIFSIKSQTCISQRGSTLNSSFCETITCFLDQNDNKDNCQIRS